MKNYEIYDAEEAEIMEKMGVKSELKMQLIIAALIVATGIVFYMIGQLVVTL